MKKLIEIKDVNFDLSIRKPKYFEWIKTNNPVNEKTFVSDIYIQQNSNGIAWLVEPPAIYPHIYEWIKFNHNKYKYVLTFSEELLSKGENFLYYPFGNTLLNEEQYDLYQNDKNKLISMVVSCKNYTEGHKLRHNLKNKINNKVDLFGDGINNVYVPKIDACKNYLFQVVIENSKYEYYFTEKIIDCFLTGVIPIYWGSSKVLELFDKNSIITFNTEIELIDIVNNVTTETYYEKINSIKNNFNIAKEYTYSEDWIFKNYNFLFS
jgi:hypothetical protein